MLKNNVTYFSIISVLFLLITFLWNFNNKSEQQFSYLASSFLQGKTYFLEKPDTWQDSVLFNGKYYWPLGPMPAVFLMPLTIIKSLFFKGVFYQGSIQPFLVLFVFWVVVKISKKLGFAKDESILLGFAFCFSSIFLQVAVLPWSWHFAQVITTLLLLCSILEYMGKKRYLLLGIIFAAILATRLTAGLGIIFFVLEIIFSKKNVNLKNRNLFFLVFPFVLTFILLLFYNYLRFGNFFDQGYLGQLIPPLLEARRSLGLFSIDHIPSNIYYFLLNVPHGELKPLHINPDAGGYSILVTSPYYLYLIFLKYKDKISKVLIFTIILTALPIFLYYGVGWKQFGYRYSLDFLPFLFFLLIKNYKEKYKKISFGFSSLVLISSITNLYFFINLFYGNKFKI